MDKNRTRKNRVSLRLDDTEMFQLQQNMKAASKTNREAYLRKMALDGCITTIDTKPISDLVRLVANISSNINQIAKRCNETGSAYEQDVLALQAEIDLLKPLIVEAHRNSVKIKSRIAHKNPSTKTQQKYLAKKVIYSHNMD